MATWFINPFRFSAGSSFSYTELNQMFIHRNGSSWAYPAAVTTPASWVDFTHEDYDDLNEFDTGTDPHFVFMSGSNPRFFIQKTTPGSDDDRGRHLIQGFTDGGITSTVYSTVRTNVFGSGKAISKIAAGCDKFEADDYLVSRAYQDGSVGTTGSGDKAELNFKSLEFPASHSILSIRQVDDASISSTNYRTVDLNGGGSNLVYTDDDSLIDGVDSTKIQLNASGKWLICINPSFASSGGGFRAIGTSYYDVTNASESFIKIMTNYYHSQQFYIYDSVSGDEELQFRVYNYSSITVDNIDNIISVIYLGDFSEAPTANYLHVKSTSNETTSGTDTTWLQTEETSSGVYNSSSCTYTVEETGIYLLQGNINSDDSDQLVFECKNNGTSVTTVRSVAFIGSSAATNGDVPVLDILNLTAGDQITFALNSGIDLLAAKTYMKLLKIGE